MRHFQPENKPGRLSSQPQVTHEILEILRKPISYIPPSIKVSKPAKEFQFFEVLSAYIMSLIEADFEWTVTPLRHDRGVDFYGERVLFQLTGLEDSVRVILAGQCKASQNTRTPIPSDTLRLLNTVNPAIVFIFSMSDISKKRIIDAQKIFSAETRRQCQILGIHDVVRLVYLYSRQILDFLHHSLNSKDQEILRTFILNLPTVNSENIEVETQIPEKVLAGSPFFININVHSVLLCKSAIRVRWRFSSSTMLIKPTELVTPEGMLLKCGESFSLCFSLKAISYHVGEISLGELVFEVNGVPVKTIDLGSLTTVDQYHPIFFWEPYNQHRARFMELLEKSEAYSPVGITVTGQGGAGKTRFCQELGYLAEQRGAEFLSVSHPQDLEHPYRIFGILAQELLSNPFNELNPKEALESYILSLHTELYQRAKNTIAVIFPGGAAGRGTFDREVMLQLLLLLLLRKAKSNTYLLHFTDLHWASTETLEILGDLLQQLKKLAAKHFIAILFLFEGRVQTNLKQSTEVNSSGQTRSTAIFENFIDQYQLEQFEIRPLSSNRSVAFLKHLFENTQSENRSIATELIPHQDLLIREIARYGQGNPFHMIEQIRLLRHEGIIERNQRTGLIFLKDLPKTTYQVPSSVYDLISLRLNFIENSSPELGLLIKSIGLIKDRIDSHLFSKLHSALARQVPESMIQQVEILDTETPSEVKFRHENYYHVIRGALLSPSERQKVISLYLRWYDDRHPKTAEILYEQALVHTKNIQMDRAVIQRLLNKALRKAEISHQYQLAVLIIEQLLRIFPPEMSVYARPLANILADIRLRIKLADFSSNLQDWNIGAEQFQVIIASINEYLQNIPRLSPASRLTLNYFRTVSMVGLANTNTDLGKSHLSVQLLTEARKTCESYFALGILNNEKDQQQWNKLYCSTLNRLGEANWMDGNYAESLLALENATLAIDKTIQQSSERLLQHHINFLDYGAVLLHEKPTEAVSILKKSLSLVPAKGWSPRYKILAETTLAIGELVDLFLNEKGNSLYFREFLEKGTIPRLQQNFEKAIFYGFKQEQVVASLMLGISFSMLNDRKAIQWYIQSIETAFRSNNLESLWRGHLNLGQYLASTGNIEAVIFHCNRARQLLSNDLQKRSPSEGKWRQRHLERPIMRIADLLPEGELVADSFIYSIVKRLKSDARPAKPVVSESFFSDKIIFLWDGDNEYYTYGG